MTTEEKDKKIVSSIKRNIYTYSLVNSWIVNADNKASISFGMVSGVFGVMVF